MFAEWFHFIALIDPINSIVFGRRCLYMRGTFFLFIIILYVKLDILKIILIYQVRSLFASERIHKF